MVWSTFVGQRGAQVHPQEAGEGRGDRPYGAVWLLRLCWSGSGGHSRPGHLETGGQLRKAGWSHGAVFPLEEPISLQRSPGVDSPTQALCFEG